MNLGNGLISYNGWTNTLTRQSGGAPADGWEVISADPSPIGVTQYLDKKALQDGMDANDIYENQRTIQMIVGVYGSTEGRFWDNLQTVLAKFNPQIAFNSDTANLGFVALDFYQPTALISTWPLSTYPHGIPMRFYARPAAPPAYNIKKIATEGATARGLSAQAAITLICRDPRKYRQTSIDVTVNTSALGLGVSLTYRGDYNTWPTFTITAAGAGTSTFRVSYSASSAGTATGVVVLDLSGASADDVYVVDTGKRSVTKNGEGASSVIQSTTRWAPLLPSDNIVSRTTDSGISSVVFTYREAWA